MTFKSYANEQVSLVGYVGFVALGKQFHSNESENALEMDADIELIASGLSNVAAAFVAGVYYIDYVYNYKKIGFKMLFKIYIKKGQPIAARFFFCIFLQFFYKIYISKSFSRTAANADVGGQTLFVNTFVAIAVCLVLLILTPLFGVKMKNWKNNFFSVTIVFFIFMIAITKTCFSLYCYDSCARINEYQRCIIISILKKIIYAKKNFFL